MEQITVIKRDGTQIPLNSYSNVSGITKAEQQMALLGEDLVNITLTSKTPLNLDLGDYITVFGKKYTLNSAPDVEKTSEIEYQYKVKFEGAQYEIAKVQYLDEDDTGVSLSGDFALTGNLRLFMDVLINNLDRVYSNMWLLGTCPDTDVKTLSFSSENCLAALQQLCQEFETEFSITFDGSRYTIDIGSAGNIFPEAFSYGQGRGLWKLERKNVSEKNPVSRLFAYGGSRNLRSGYRGFSTRLKMPNVEFIEDSAAIAAYGVIEGTVVFEDIYPHREGVITALGNDVYAFFDDGMDFNINDYLVGGTSAKIHFNTGNLAGYTFELKSYDQSKQFVLMPYNDERGMRFPSETSDAFKIKVGDKYTLIDIYMPDSYVTNAENSLLERAQEYLAENKSPRVQYGLTFDELYLKSKVPEGTVRNFFTVGDYIPIKDNALGIDKNVRVQSFVRDIIREYQYKLTLNDNTEISIIQQLIASEVDTSKIIVENRLNDVSRSLQNWRTTQELRDMAFDPDGYYYTDKIKVNSIETNQLTTGARSTQLETNVILEPNYNANPNVVNVSTGILTHLAIEDEPRTWSITAASYVMNSSSTAYYIYARCLRQGNTGEIIFSTEQIKVDNDPMYYHFLLGILHSVDSNTNVRWISLTYGTTAINGRFIRTGRIQSADGKTWFDLDTGEISGKITFINSNGQYESVEDAINNIEIGGVNLLLNSDFRKSTSDAINWAVTTYWTYSFENGTACYSSINNVNAARLERTVYFKAGTYTISLRAKAPYGFNFATWVNGIPASNEPLEVNDFAIHKVTFEVPIDANVTMRLYTRTRYAIGDKIYIEWVQIEKGNIPSDWSPAPEDIEAEIAATQEAVENAQASADAANSLLADIANDNKLTPEEKQSTKLEWDKIAAEYPKVTADATYYSITYAAYSNAYNILSAYIIPLLSNLTSTSDIVGTTFRNNFLSYYNARQNLLNLVSQRAKDIGDKKGNNLLYPELLKLSEGGALSPEDWNKFAGTLNGGTDQNLIVSSENPFGEQAKMWKCESVNGDGLSANGGFTSLAFAVDLEETYRFAVFVKKKSDIRSYIYLGTKSNLVETLDGVPDNNPYFVNTNGSTWNLISADKWYLMVGYIFPSGYVDENHVTLSGFYDVTTGKVITQIPRKDLRFRNDVSSKTAPMRAFQFYGVQAGIEVLFYAPMAHKCDGTEPSLATILGIDPYAQGIAQAAQQAASNAQQTAQQATDRLDDWASDSYISPTEKTGLLQQKADIQSEYGDIKSQATLYSLTTSTQWTAYNTVYTLAIAALNKYTAAAPENIPVDADYSNLASYYAARQTILDLIAQKAKDNVDNIQIGGVNLLINSDFTKGGSDGTNWGHVSYWPYSYEGGYACYTCVNNASASRLQRNVYLAAGTYTISIKAQAAYGFNFKNFVNGVVTQTTRVVAADFAIHTAVFDVPADATVTIMPYAGNYAIGDKIYIQWIKIERGNRPTDWSPAPADIEAQIQSAQAAATAAATAATTAQTAANTANALLADIANDNKLTPEEKQSTKLEWDKIVAEYPKITADADYYGVSKTSYVIAYDNLSAYITPLLASLTTTSDITGTVFRSTFVAYYTARQNLLNLVSQRAKDLADAAASAAADAQSTADAAQSAVSNLDYLKQALQQNTEISGGLISTSVINLGETVGGVRTDRAGLNGLGNSESEIRIWAGASFGNRASALFRVAQSGAVVMTNATVQSSTGDQRVVIDSATNTMTFSVPYGAEALKIYAVQGLATQAFGVIEMTSITRNSIGSQGYVRAHGYGIDLYQALLNGNGSYPSDNMRLSRFTFELSNGNTAQSAPDLSSNYPGVSSFTRGFALDIYNQTYLRMRLRGLPTSSGLANTNEVFTQLMNGYYVLAIKL